MEESFYEFVIVKSIAILVIFVITFLLFTYSVQTTDAMNLVLEEPNNKLYNFDVATSMKSYDSALIAMFFFMIFLFLLNAILVTFYFIKYEMRSKETLVDTFIFVLIFFIFCIIGGIISKYINTFFYTQETNAEFDRIIMETAFFGCLIIYFVIYYYF